MNRLTAYPLVLSSASLLLPVIVDAAVKGFVLLLAAAAATLALRRASASLRHLVWVSAMVGLLALPFLAMALPAWRVLPWWIDDSVASLPGFPESEAVVVEPRAGEPAAPAAAPWPLPHDAEPSFGDTATQWEPLTATGNVIQGTAASNAPPMQGEDVAVAAVAVWAAGVCLLFARLALSQLVLSHLAGGSRKVTSGRVHREFQALRRRLGVRRAVALLESARRAMPMTWGVFRAHVLLPSESDSWDRGRLRAVLFHELAHVKRRAALIHLLVQITCALYWFNPLVWIAARRIRVEQERACDDVVLGHGTKPSDYAEHLLGIATGYDGRKLAGVSALAMARKTQLEGRLLSVLDDQVSRRQLSRRALAVSLVVIAAVVVPVAMMQAADDSTDPARDEAAPVVRGPAETGRHSSHAPDEASAADRGANRNRVVDAQGKPVVGAKVELYRRPLRLSKEEEPFASTTTDNEGEYSYPAETPQRRQFYLVVSAPAFRTDEWIGNSNVHRCKNGVRLPDTLRLDRPVTISGIVLGPDGTPLAGVPLEVDCHSQGFHYRLTSGEGGRFKDEGLPTGEIFIRYERYDNDPATHLPVKARLCVIHVHAEDGETIDNVVVDLSKAIEINLNCALEGRVVDHEGNGIGNADVRADIADVRAGIAGEYRLDHSSRTKTDAQGRFRMEGLPPEEFDVSAETNSGLGGESVRVKLVAGKTKGVRILGYRPGHPPPEERKTRPVWGQPAGGLEAAIFIRPDREAYSIGETIEVRLLLRNTGKKVISFSHNFSLAAELHVKDENGKEQTFNYLHFFHYPTSTIYVLEPGHEVEMTGDFELELADARTSLNDTPEATFSLRCHLKARYKLSCNLGNGLGTGERILAIAD
ncbi:MAG: M56 family metallopeptidase [Planctomycetota bacterium]|jgi:beta-lactamase regulating signal transducer with metallopeptidase domain/protocatechuate 3,4-dioxygenase beta subunit